MQGDCGAGRNIYLFAFVSNHSEKMYLEITLFSFYNNLFYKNIKAEILLNVKNVFKNKPEAEILKKI